MQLAMCFADKGLFTRVVFSMGWMFLFGALGQANAPKQPAGFSYAALQAMAHSLAQTEYHAETKPELPESLKKLSYDDYQSIRFLSSQGPWQKEELPFSFQFFHRGFIYHDPVKIHLVEQGQVSEFGFSPAQFDYGKLNLRPSLAPNLDFAGVRILYPLNLTNKQDEVAAFLGASYFRLVAAHQRYGASARGLAIDTAEPSGEEFPRFTQFWIEKPVRVDTSARLYALLDGPSVAGAYRFTLHPGQITQVEVEAALFFRKPVKKLGIAPVTSMFLVGENRTRFVPDFRPEVHDSDGLLIEPGSPEWLWRPLINPEKEHVVSRFPVSRLRGFGLLQRDRQFDHYQDLAGRYELRPSYWVKPSDNWGTGVVELVEIPTPAEWNDNIVSYWVPAHVPERGEELHLSYQLSACAEVPEKSGLLKVESTRITPEHDKTPSRFVMDFSAGDSGSLPADSKIETKVECSHGSIRNLVAEKNEVTGGWRTFFDLADPGNKPVEVRAFLHQGTHVLSETWIYHSQ